MEPCAVVQQPGEQLAPPPKASLDGTAVVQLSQPPVVEAEAATAKGKGVSHADIEALMVAPAAVPARTGKPTPELVAEVKAKVESVSKLVLKVGDSWAPWKASKNRVRSEQALSELGRLRMLVSLQAEALTRMEEENQELHMLKVKTEAQEASIAKLKAKLAEMHESKAEKASAVSSMLSKVEGATNGPKRYLRLDERKEGELLQARVDLLVKEHERLRAENERLAASRVELAKRLKEANEKLRDEADVREREMRRVNSEMRRAGESKDQAVTQARQEAAEQLAARARDLKATQKRMETMKAELDHLKHHEQAVQKQAELAKEASAKAQAEAKAALKKATDARVEREEALQQLALAREETAMVASEYAQVTKLACAHAPGGAKALPLMAYVKEVGAPFPRTAFTARGSVVLHSCACGKVDATAALQPREYRSAKEVEAWLADGSVVLCSQCKLSGF